jgi:hypothetical protein
MIINLLRIISESMLFYWVKDLVFGWIKIYIFFNLDYFDIYVIFYVFNFYRFNKNLNLDKELPLGIKIESKLVKLDV